MSRLNDIVPERCVWRIMIEQGAVISSDPDLRCYSCRGYKGSALKNNCDAYHPYNLPAGQGSTSPRINADNHTLGVYTSFASRETKGGDHFDTPNTPLYSNHDIVKRRSK